METFCTSAWSSDAAFMAQALESAQRNLHLPSPNPCVGAALVSPSGELLSTGATEPVGGAHAEIVALRNAGLAGHSALGATLYVTLEPCSHHGRTAPCVDAIEAAGIRKVVAALPDPNPLVAGKGFARLQAAGIEVQRGLCAAEAREQLIGFLSRMTRRRPWVRMKVAASLDGFTALTNGESQWITSPQARADGHAWRARASAVLTGIGTVLADDPTLNVREFDTPRQPVRVVVDSGLQTPLTAKLVATASASAPVWIYGAQAADAASADQLRMLGADAKTLPDSANSPGKLDLLALMHDLGSREINEVHVEAGFKLNGSLLAAGLVDEILLYTAPTLLGQGMGIAKLPALASLAQKPALKLIDSRAIGPDLRSIWRITDPQSFFPI